MAKLSASQKTIGWLFLKEIIIFLIILLVLAFLWHPDLLSSPLARAERLMNTSQASVFHPLMWSGAIYCFAGVIRLFMAFIRKLQSR